MNNNLLIVTYYYLVTIIVLDGNHDRTVVSNVKYSSKATIYSLKGVLEITIFCINSVYWALVISSTCRSVSCRLQAPTVAEAQNQHLDHLKHATPITLSIIYIFVQKLVETDGMGVDYKTCWLNF